MGETATRILLGFVIAGALVLAAGVVILIWLLTTGVQGDKAQTTGGTAIMRLGDGERITAVARGADDIVLLLEHADGRQEVRTIDPATGTMLFGLKVENAR